MRLQKILLSIFIYFSINSFGFAQYISVDDSYTAQQLVQNVLLNSGCANVSNITVTSSQNGSGSGYGFFSKNGSAFPFLNGVILSTGTATSAVGPNGSLLSEGATSWIGDSDLEQALGISGSINATILEFDFTPLTTNFSFDYIFSSEQYLTSPTPNQCNFTDGFAFLLKKVNTTDPYINLAVVPNTDIPVKVNTVRGTGTVCPAANETYFDGFNGAEHPTNFNGQTVVLKATSTVVAGVTYHIKLVIADQGNNLYDSAIFLGGGSFNSTSNIGTNRLFATNNPLCENETLVLNVNESGATGFQWYKNGQALTGETNSSYTVTNAGTYTVEITIGTATCKAIGEIEIEYSNLPALSSPATLVQCDDNTDGITTYNLTKLDAFIKQNNAQLGTVIYYLNQNDATNQSNAIQNPTSYSNSLGNQLIARVSNQYGCSNFANVTLQIANNTLPNQNPILICDEDGTLNGLTSTDLNQVVSPQVTTGLPSGLLVEYYATASNAVSQTNVLPNNFTNTTPNTQTIFARIINGPDCYGIIPVTLQIIVFNPANFNDETVIICENVPEIVTVASGYSSYLWSTGATTSAISITSGGNYTVTVTNASGCEATKTFSVLESGKPTITSVDINDFSGNNNTVYINVSGNGDFEYSIDGSNFQNSPLFSNVLIGEYTVVVRDKNFCGFDNEPITVLDYPKYFTPNDDGYNDRWFIKNLSNNSLVTIFDRFGKAIYNFKGNQPGWNGKLKNNELFSTDYWFVLTLENQKIIKGHFSLKR
jgi:gliding motility-associated-like protein